MASAVPKTGLGGCYQITKGLFPKVPWAWLDTTIPPLIQVHIHGHGVLAGFTNAALRYWTTDAHPLSSNETAWRAAEILLHDPLISSMIALYITFRLVMI